MPKYNLQTNIPNRRDGDRTRNKAKMDTNMDETFVGKGLVVSVICAWVLLYLTLAFLVFGLDWSINILRTIGRGINNLLG